MPQDKPMRIRRASHNAQDKYFMCSRDTAQDKTLSYDALGMLGYLLSKPSDWMVQPSDLIREKCGRDKVYGTLNELIDSRYLERIYIRDKRGKVLSVEYVVYEEPFPENLEPSM